MSQATIDFLRMQNEAPRIPSLADDLQAIKEGRHPYDADRAVNGGFVEFCGAAIKLTPSGERALRYMAIAKG